MTGSEMRELRLRSGLYQIEVALEMGLDNETICRWERSNKELPRAHEHLFKWLVGDEERCGWIIASRRQRRRTARYYNKREITPPPA